MRERRWSGFDDERFQTRRGRWWARPDGWCLSPAGTGIPDTSAASMAATRRRPRPIQDAFLPQQCHAETLCGHARVKLVVEPRPIVTEFCGKRQETDSRIVDDRGNDSGDM